MIYTVWFSNYFYFVILLSLIMSSVSLQEVWTSVEKIGYQTRISKSNGLEAWRQIKNDFSTNPIIGKTVSKILQTINEQCYHNQDSEHELVTFTFLNNHQQTITLDNSIDSEHFFIQHFRIPIMLKYQLTYQKFAQIAYNAGQFRASRDMNCYSSDICLFYDKYQLNKYEIYVESIE